MNKGPSITEPQEFFKKIKPKKKLEKVKRFEELLERTKNRRIMIVQKSQIKSQPIIHNILERGWKKYYAYFDENDTNTYLFILQGQGYEFINERYNNKMFSTVSLTLPDIFSGRFMDRDETFTFQRKGSAVINTITHNIFKVERIYSYLPQKLQI